LESSALLHGETWNFLIRSSFRFLVSRSSDSP
jgi:hypothetical protein